MAYSDRSLTLFSVLLNPLVYSHTLPYLTVSGLLSLAATSRAFRDLVYQDAASFRCLDLSTAKGASAEIEPIDRGGETWRSQRMDEGVTEEDFYCGPLRGIFSSLRKQSLLQHVQTLVLDGQSAPAEILHEIINEPGYSIRILSVVGSKHLNEAKFRQILNYAVRPQRPEGSPRLQGVYIFGTNQSRVQELAPLQPGPSVTDSESLGSAWNRRSRDALAASLGRSTDIWYAGPGRVLPKTSGSNLDKWAPVLKACEGVIAFDAILCRGPKHYLDTKDADGAVICRDYVDPAIASTVVAGCENCGSMPEGAIYAYEAPSSCLPLLAPPPRHHSSIIRAQRPNLAGKSALSVPLFARCTECLIQRCCEACFMFWCEDCYDDEALKPSNYRELQRTNKLKAKAAGSSTPEPPSPKKPGTRRECWECGRLVSTACTFQLRQYS